MICFVFGYTKKTPFLLIYDLKIIGFKGRDLFWTNWFFLFAFCKGKFKFIYRQKLNFQREKANFRAVHKANQKTSSHQKPTLTQNGLIKLKLYDTCIRDPIFKHYTAKKENQFQLDCMEISDVHLNRNNPQKFFIQMNKFAVIILLFRNYTLN